MRNHSLLIAGLALAGLASAQAQAPCLLDRPTGPPRAPRPAPRPIEILPRLSEAPPFHTPYRAPDPASKPHDPLLPGRGPKLPTPPYAQQAYDDWLEKERVRKERKAGREALLKRQARHKHRLD